MRTATRPHLPARPRGLETLDQPTLFLKVLGRSRLCAALRPWEQHSKHVASIRSGPGCPSSPMVTPWAGQPQEDRRTRTGPEPDRVLLPGPSVGTESPPPRQKGRGPGPPGSSSPGRSALHLHPFPPRELPRELTGPCFSPGDGGPTASQEEEKHVERAASAARTVPEQPAHHLTDPVVPGSPGRRACDMSLVSRNQT